MKFVTVMDMWLLIINICMMGGLFYFGRKLLRTMTRLMHVGEMRDDNSERRRCIQLVEFELDHYRSVYSMEQDAHTKEIITMLEQLVKDMRKAR